MRARMTFEQENSARESSNLRLTWAKAAATWLSLVAASTLVNSLILFKYSRFVTYLSAFHLLNSLMQFSWVRHSNCPVLRGGIRLYLLWCSTCHLSCWRWFSP